jgi:P27 family predicted phage terminase small subunit
VRGRKPAAIVTGTSTLGAVPRPPAWLSKDAKAEWRRVAPILVERNVLTDGDLGVLETYCSAIGTAREAQRTLNAEGLTLAGKRHPVFGILNAAQTNARLCAAELGLTPVSRSRPAIRDDAGGDELEFLG